MSSMRIVTGALVVAAILGGNAAADIGPKPRSWAPGLEVPGTDLEGIEVEMTEEDVRLTLSKGKGDGAVTLRVEVDFRMTNLGPETSFEEGFPVGPVLNMRDFSIEIDGQPVEHRLIDRLHPNWKPGSPGDRARSPEPPGGPGGGDEDWGDETPRDYWYVWDARFPGHAVSRHVVRYSLDIWHWSPYRQTGYILHTGAPWKNRIRRASVTLRTDGVLTLDHLLRLAPADGAVRHADRVEWTFADLEPTEAHDIAIHFHAEESFAERLAAMREESKIRWSVLPEIVREIDERPRQFLRDAPSAEERLLLLDTLAAMLAEGTWNGDRFVLPAMEEEQCTFPKDMPAEQVAMMRRMMPDVERPYARAGGAGHLLGWLARVVDTAAAAAEDADAPRAREVLAIWLRVAEAALEGRVLAGDRPIDFDAKSKAEAVAALRARIARGQEILESRPRH